MTGFQVKDLLMREKDRKAKSDKEGMTERQSY